MKKYFLPALAACLLLCTAFAVAVGGGADDPLLSLSYLRSTFTAAMEKKADGALDAADASIYQSAAAQLQTGACAPTFTERRLDQGDALSGATGMNLLVLVGSVKVTFPSGALIDVTSAAELPSGSTLQPGHRYMVAEDTTALFTVTSKTAVVSFCGYYTAIDGTGLDYTAMADALKALTLFRGSDTGYGAGYDLELAPTRIQALIMLIRLLGEENAALACTAECPFTDVKAANTRWALPYVAYAYQKGYTNGISQTEFGMALTASAGQYIEFVLRALGYSSTANIEPATAPARALAAGVITAGENAALQGGQFLRADVVYYSYYALSTPVSGSSQTLRNALIAKGLFTDAAAASAMAAVKSARVA